MKVRTPQATVEGIKQALRNQSAKLIEDELIGRTYRGRD